MPRIKTMKVLLTFPTTTQAMAMEKAAGEEQVPGRLIPVPVAISAGCGMAFSGPAAARKQLISLAKSREIEVEGVYELLS